MRAPEATSVLAAFSVRQFLLEAALFCPGVVELRSLLPQRLLSPLGLFACLLRSLSRFVCGACRLLEALPGRPSTLLRRFELLLAKGGREFAEWARQWGMNGRAFVDSLRAV